MNLKLLIKIFLTIAWFAMVTGCGIPEPPAQVASDDSPPAQTPVEAPTQAPAVGFTPSSKCLVPDIVGLDQSAAEGSLVGVGLQPVKSNEYNDLVAAGAVISQDPPAGTTLEPCQGDVVIVVSLGSVPVPTQTPGPTETPAPPTETPIPTPVPPTVTPTPDPRLFFDDFEAGVKPEWGMSGNFATVNGKLIIDRALEGYLGDTTWTDYAIVFHELAYHDVWELRLRRQDKDNYMVVKFTAGFSGHQHWWKWYKVINGEEQEIPGAAQGQWFNRDGNLVKIEAEGSTYRLFLNGDQKVYFTDNTFDKGGIGLIVIKAAMNMDSMEVLQLP